jgi:hypothetical protein
MQNGIAVTRVVFLLFPARIDAGGATWLRGWYQVNILAISSADAKREATSSAVCSLGRP